MLQRLSWLAPCGSTGGFVHSGNFLGIGRLGLSAVDRLHLVRRFVYLGPVDVHLYAENDVEDQCYGNAGRHDPVINLGGSCEQTGEAACNLGHNCKGRKLPS